ncbi:MAG: choice-of-anchor V domain-containing protein [Polyangiaceae bacterium]
MKAIRNRFGAWCGRAFATAAAVGVIASAATAAFAFPFGYSWMQPSDGNINPLPDTPLGRAGGGGYFYTGGKQDKGLACSVCHVAKDDQGNDVNTEGVIVGNLTPAFANNTYTPGTKYNLTMTLVGEHHVQGAGAPNTLNGFSLTVEDASGKLAGVLASDIPNIDSTPAHCPQTYPAMNPTNGTTYVYGSCKAIIYIPKPNTTTWNFSWTAPPQGTGPVTIYFSVVDGNHTDESALGDDVYDGKITLNEG